jgi:hypothetical protein
MVGVMPKFNIYEPLGSGILPSELAPDVQQRRISVGWSKGRHAQIGVGVIDNTVTVPEQVSWSGDFLLESEKDESGLKWRSQWVNLDRRTINQLIHELRKARDEAFGRDE